MAIRKVRPHPGALEQVLKRLSMTQMDAKSRSGIDRKTLAKIDRGEDVKEETLQRLASKLGVPITHFEPPVTASVEDSPLLDPKFILIMLRKVAGEDVADLLKSCEKVNWRINVHAIADDTVQLLEQLEDAVKDLKDHLARTDFADGSSLRQQLNGLKKTKHVATLLEELTKHGLSMLGGEYLSWESENDFGLDVDGNEAEFIRYLSHSNALFSIEAHPAQPRRASVWQGTEPPRFAPNRATVISVNGTYLETAPRERRPAMADSKGDMDDEIPF